MGLPWTKEFGHCLEVRDDLMQQFIGVVSLEGTEAADALTIRLHRQKVLDRVHLN